MFEIGDVVKIVDYYKERVRDIIGIEDFGFYNQEFIIKRIDNKNKCFICIPKNDNTLGISLYEFEIEYDLTEMRKKKLKQFFNEI